MRQFTFKDHTWSFSGFKTPWCLGLILLLTGLSGYGQVSGYTFSQSSGTYAAVSGGTNILAANADDSNSSATNIGFTFNFNGTNFTQFVANSNGHIRLGATAAATNNYAPLSTTSNTNAISAYGRDGLVIGGVVTAIQGTSPNRVRVIEYINYQVQWNDTGSRLNMQIRLYEGTNAVEIIYGSGIRNTTSYEGQIGLRGGTATADFINRTTTSNWASTTAGTANNNTVRYNSTVFPASGLTFRWAPATCFPPTALTNSGITSVSANHAWTAPSPAPSVGYEWAVTTSASAPASGTATTSLTASSSGLTPNTTYYLHVRSNCGSGDFSSWATSAFSTPILFAVPYLEEFETTATGWTTNSPEGFGLGSARGATGNPGNSVFKNLYNFTGFLTSQITSPTLGPIVAGQELTFDWKTTNWSSPFGVPGANTGNFIVAISTNFGETYTNVATVSTGANNVYNVYKLDLTPYAGQNVRFRITANLITLSADYDIAFDNFKIAFTPPTISASTCNNTFNVVPGELISCDPLAGATNYRFNIVDENSVSYLVERATGSMTVNLFAELIGSGFQYDHTYTISAQAFINGAWTAYGASCPFSITDDPRTKLRADFCDLPLAAQDTRIFVDRLPLFNQYVYTVRNTSTNQSVTFTKTDPQATGFRLTLDAPSILSAGTTYEVSVQAKLGSWVTPIGTVCTVSTPAIPGTIKLRAGSCDVTLTSMINQAVLSEVVTNAVEYQFEVRNTTLNTAPVTFLKSNWVLPMSDLGAGFTNNTTYSIRVRARVGSTFNSYGTPCTVTTPSTIPAPKLTALYCDQTFESYRSLYANRVTNSQEFTFEVTNDQSEETIEVVRPGNFFHLANHTSAAFLYEGTSFTIRVKVKVNNVYSNYGTPCVVTIGAVNLLNQNLNGVASLEKIEAYPNPFTNQFTIKLTDLTTANIQVFDINGRLVQSQTTNDTFEVEMGQNLSTGIYQVRVEQNGEIQSFKMIKK